jgi:hypothetical protein
MKLRPRLARNGPFTPSPQQPLDRRDWCIEKIISKNFQKKTGDSEKGYYQYLKFSIAQKKWLNLVVDDRLANGSKRTSPRSLTNR